MATAVTLLLAIVVGLQVNEISQANGNVTFTSEWSGLTGAVCTLESNNTDRLKRGLSGNTCWWHEPWPDRHPHILSVSVADSVSMVSGAGSFLLLSKKFCQSLHSAAGRMF